MINVLACYAFIFLLDNLFKITDFGGEEKEDYSANRSHFVFMLFILFVRNFCKSQFVFVVILIFVFYQ